MRNYLLWGTSKLFSVTLTKIVDQLRSFRRFNGNVSYSQCGEDLLVSRAFRSLGIPKPTYLDVGAYHPILLSNTYLFYRRGCCGTCVEPDPLLFAKIQRLRRRDTCLNVGVGTGNETHADLYIMSARILNTFSKEEAERCQSYGNHKIEQVIKIPLLNINNMIRKCFPLSCPNYVSLDVEGWDFAILQSLDFSLFRPQVFCVETITYTEDNSERKMTEIMDFMGDNEYFTYADTYINTVFLDRVAWQKRG